MKGCRLGQGDQGIVQADMVCNWGWEYLSNVRKHGTFLWWYMYWLAGPVERRGLHYSFLHDIVISAKKI